MKKTLVFLVFCLCSVSLPAQIGVSLGVRHINAPFWQFLLGENQALLRSGHHFSTDYTLALKNINIELVPEVGFSKFSNVIKPRGDYGKRTFIAQFFHVQLNSNIYPFNFFHQLNNQTKASASNRFAKSLFCRISAGVAGVNLSYRASTEEMLLPPRRNTIFVGAGLGFNLIFNNYLTLTPIVKYEHYPTVVWPGFSELRDENSADLLRDETFINQFGVALRLGLEL